MVNTLSRSDKEKSSKLSSEHRRRSSASCSSPSGGLPVGLFFVCGVDNLTRSPGQVNGIARVRRSNTSLQAHPRPERTQFQLEFASWRGLRPVHVPTWDWMKAGRRQLPPHVLDQAGPADMTDLNPAASATSVAGHRRNLRQQSSAGSTASPRVTRSRGSRRPLPCLWSPSETDATRPHADARRRPRHRRPLLVQNPTERWITMTTCHLNTATGEALHRSPQVRTWTPCDQGVPAEPVDEPTNRDPTCTVFPPPAWPHLVQSHRTLASAAAIAALHLGPPRVLPELGCPPSAAPLTPACGWTSRGHPGPGRNLAGR